MLDQFLTTNTPTPHQTDRQSNSHISHRERDDAYFGTIVQFSPRWRLVLCKDQMQWIIQKKESSRRGDWRGLKYLNMQRQRSQSEWKLRIALRSELEGGALCAARVRKTDK